MDSQVEMNSIELWFESVQGMAGGQRVHIGQRAILYPNQHYAVIERWGPKGNTRDVISTPEEIKDKMTAIMYLNGQTDVPSDVIRSIRWEMRPDRPTEPSLILPDGTAISASGGQLVGFKRSITGYSDYCFFYENEEVCTISNIPFKQSPLIITGMGRTWSSIFDEDTTIIAGGTSRIVRDNNTKQKVLQIKYLGSDRYELLFDRSEVMAYPNSSGYHFVSDHHQIGYIERITEYPWRPEETHCEITPCMKVRLQEDISTDTILAILAFPYLRFAL